MSRANPLGAEFRTVREVEHEGQPARTVEGSRVYPTDREDLWEAVTSPERLPRWFLPIEGELEVGGRYQLEGNAGGTIQRCERPEGFEVTWEYGGNVSWVSVAFEPVGDGTRMTLVHTMLRDEDSEKHWANYGPSATGIGWDLSFYGLGLHLDSGETLDPTWEQEWLATEEGRAFLRTLATAWGEAHIAGGEDPEVAQAMAERTAGFYSGE